MCNGYSLEGVTYNINGSTESHDISEISEITRKICWVNSAKFSLVHLPEIFFAKGSKLKSSSSVVNAELQLPFVCRQDQPFIAWISTEAFMKRTPSVSDHDIQ
jgi:hypothetical protein